MEAKEQQKTGADQKAAPPWWKDKKVWGIFVTYVVCTLAAAGLAAYVRQTLYSIPPDPAAGTQGKDVYAPLVTAMGGVLLLVSLIWTRIRLVVGTGSLHGDDVDVVGILLSTFGIVATVAGILAEPKLGQYGLAAVVGGGVMMIILLLVSLFGTSVVRIWFDSLKRSKGKKPART